MSAAAIPDSGARRRALDPAGSFIVQAPAGSGKTGLLIQRYLRLLASVEHPEEIIAITFTRKAAGEMRERVLEALAQARSGTASASEHERTTLELAAAALARDTEAGWGVTENPARLRIQTIDSLCAALTRQMPMLSRFGSQPESVEDARALYVEAARATLGMVEGDEAVAQDVERLLTHLDNDVGRIEGLLAEMLRRRDHWLRHVHGRERVGLEAALKSERRGTLGRARGLLPEEARSEWAAIAGYAFASLERGKFNDGIEDWAALAREVEKLRYLFNDRYIVQLFRVGWDGSWFTNHMKSLVWDNPIRITDFNNGLLPPSGPYDPSGYSNGNGPAQGRESTAPNNMMHVVSATGLYKMRGRTTLNGTVQLTSQTQDDALIPFTINSAINSPAVFAAFPHIAQLPRSTAQAEAKGINTLINLSSPGATAGPSASASSSARKPPRPCRSTCPTGGST